MRKLKLAPVTRERVLELGHSMSPADRKEVYLSSGNPPEYCLLESVWLSEWSWAIVDDEDHCVAIFGCAAAEGVHIPWMLTSIKFKRHAREFARRCRVAINYFFRKYPFLLNYVHAEHHESIRWLTWCGFNVETEEIPVGPFGSPFRRFTLCANQQR